MLFFGGVSCVFEWKALTPNDLIQAAAIPGSLFVGYLIFRLGETSSKSKVRNEFALKISSDCIAMIDLLEKEALDYWTQSAQAKGSEKLETSLIQISKRLSSETLFLASFSKKDETLFRQDCVELRMAVTGGDFATKKRRQVAQRSEQILKINNCSSALRDKLKKLQSELVQ